MKKVVASLIAIGVLIGITIWWRGYVGGVVEMMDIGIDEATTALATGDMRDSLDKINMAKDQWAQSESILLLFLNHNLTTGIDLNFERAHSYAERGEAVEAVAELRSARHSLHDLESSLDITLRNIM